LRRQICLGLPWLAKSLMTGASEGTWYISVNSEALAYTVISLLLSLMLLYIVFLIGRFVLTRSAKQFGASVTVHRCCDF
jgi:hypothetical protein